MLAGSIPKQLPLRGLRWSGPGVSAPRSPSAARRRSAPAASRYSKYRLLQRLDTAVYVLLQSLACRAKVSRFEGRQNRKVILRLGIDIVRQSHSSPAVAVTPHETEHLHGPFGTTSGIDREMQLLMKGEVLDAILGKDLSHISLSLLERPDQLVIDLWKRELQRSSLQNQSQPVDVDGLGQRDRGDPRTLVSN